MIYFLDTDTCAFILRGKFMCAERVGAQSHQNVKVPSMVQAELLMGVRESANPIQTARKVDELLSPFEIVPFDAMAAAVYAEVRFSLKKTGNLISPNDLIIAATALAHNATLVTHNTREFNRVSGLQLADWTH